MKNRTVIEKSVPILFRMYLLSPLQLLAWSLERILNSKVATPKKEPQWRLSVPGPKKYVK